MVKCTRTLSSFYFVGDPGELLNICTCDLDLHIDLALKLCRYILKYHAYDNICKKRRVFKVETIGDCYVAVCGLPEPRKDHAGRFICCWSWIRTTAFLFSLK